MNAKILQQLPKNNHILLYQQDLQAIYKNHKTQTASVYLISPKEGKSGLLKILQSISMQDSYKNFTINQILNEISIQNKEIHIFIDNFEELTKRELRYYKQLFEIGHVSLIVNIVSDNAVFVDNDFIRQFVILNEDFYENRTESIKVKYTILIVLCVFIFLIFLKMQLGILNIIVSTLWFTFLMYRSFYYIMH